MADTIPIQKADLQQLIKWLENIETAVEFIDDNLEDNPYECLELCTKITKNLNKMRGLITAFLR
jgi:hypothetical protein